MSEPGDGAWFAAKRFGYGAGLPISWQGWVVLAAVIALSTLIAVEFARALQPLLLAPVVLLGNLPFLLLIRAKTRGGWKWRNGQGSEP